jgi:biopolymer transport protein ExbD
VSLFRPAFPGRSALVDRLHWVRLGLYALVSIAAVWSIVQLLAAPPSVEYQISEALGCRQNYPVLILRLQPDGSFRWPEGDVLSVKETLAMIPAWCDANEDGVIAVLAPHDAKLSHAVPVLNTAKESGHSRVVLATDAIAR